MQCEAPTVRKRRGPEINLPGAVEESSGSFSEFVRRDLAAGAGDEFGQGPQPGGLAEEPDAPVGQGDARPAVVEAVEQVSPLVRVVDPHRPEDGAGRWPAGTPWGSPADRVRVVVGR